ncbi:GNAT family N-acetyltransferase [Rubrivirga sp. IMCC43871]|uniref:GNAT family N-acetyltransferase n=1 Tax=Rubrivirga sp. IMCC43871 TaxID=3391575 RepID=UPI00398FD4DD
MHWYDKLNQYFPVEEMKSRSHVEALLAERSDVYHVDHGPNHVLLYVEGRDGVFVDYLLVAKEARGQGLGTQLLDRLKAKGKPILLEVEPADYDDTDTLKRQRFYAREGFQHVERLRYRRRSLATKEVNELEILAWSPEGQMDDEAAYRFVQAVYDEVHTYRDIDFYGERYQPTHEVLTLEETLTLQGDA